MARFYFPEKGANTAGVTHVYFSFVSNGTSDPTATYTSTTLRGDGAVSAVVRNSAAGKFLLTLNNSFRYVLFASAVTEDNATDDYATIGPIANEGSSTGEAITVEVYTYNAGTLADLSRRVYVHLVLKDSDAGA